jgi:TRAP-type C4-dicarboxylate transport system permease small subunit
MAAGRPGIVARAGRLSAAVAAFERAFAALLIAGVALLILLNVVTRYSGYALYWVDEAAIYVMVWATMVAASLLVRRRGLVAVTILFEFVPPQLRRLMLIVIDIIVLAFGLFLIWLSWIWFAPLEFARAGFEHQVFARNTGNFIYAEPTLTLGIRKIWVWLVMPLFAITVTIHGLANLLDTLTGRDAAPTTSPRAELR